MNYDNPISRLRALSVLPGDTASEAADALQDMQARFTRLDMPKYHGDPMLDEVLSKPSQEFREWVETLPARYWARYDLSAARIGWEAGRESHMS